MNLQGCVSVKDFSCWMCRYVRVTKLTDFEQLLYAVLRKVGRGLLESKLLNDLLTTGRAVSLLEKAAIL